MCGIFAWIGGQGGARDKRAQMLRYTALQRHRGPDFTGVAVLGNVYLAHERLAVMDPSSGAQPLVSACGNITLCVNGEIYNHRDVISECADVAAAPLTGSDCEAVLLAYEKWGQDCVLHLDGIFAFVLVDMKEGVALVARDAVGVVPLYRGVDRDNGLVIASELKCLMELCGDKVEQFAPGSRMVIKVDGEGANLPDWDPWVDSLWRRHDFSSFPEESWITSDALDGVKYLFTQAVRKQTMADVPYGVLLSGGLDSSLVAAVATRNSAVPVHTFSIGLKGSPDLQQARLVSEFLSTQHHEFTFTVEEGIDAVRDVIWHIESYDVTTVRASVPMYLMARRIKSLGVKMVLSGEGSDEMFGGYLYFHKAPNEGEFFEETKRKLIALHKYDCLRCNKSMAAWGVEARVPFLDTALVDYVMHTRPLLKMCRSAETGEPRIEKHLLRQAFQSEDDPYLPSDVLWRQKEQFSDGVGYTWIDSLKEFAEKEVNDVNVEDAGSRFVYNPPRTKEAYWYRRIFEDMFPGKGAAQTVPGGPSVACSSSVAVGWDETLRRVNDQSGRAVTDVHNHAIDD